MKTVQAKFWVSEIKNHGSYGGIGDQVATVEMLPVSADTPENAQWSKYTPSGKIEMVITNPSAVEAFELGKTYLINISPAEA